MIAENADFMECFADSVTFERSLLVAAAEWIARAPALSMKMELCRWVWSAAARARRQSGMLRSSAGLTTIEAKLDAGALCFIQTLAAAPSADGFMFALRALVAPAAAAMYGRLAARTSDEVASAARDAAGFYRRIAQGRRKRRSFEHADAPYLRRVELLCERIATCSYGEPLAIDPCERLPTAVTTPRRDHAIRALRPGEMQVENWMVSSDRDVEQYLHQMIGFELAAFEVVSRQIAEFPEMPWEFHQDMATQIRDEVTHLRMWLARLPRCRGRLGRFPLSAFEFHVCSGSDLSARLALLQRLIEGFGLEALDLNRLLWDSRGDEDMVAYIARLQMDEIVHVRQGNKWLRWLCGSEPALEAIADAAEISSRERLLEAARVLEESGAVDPDNAELLRLKFDQWWAFPLNAALRRRAGFSQAEIRRERDRRPMPADDSIQSEEAP